MQNIDEETACRMARDRSGSSVLSCEVVGDAFSVRTQSGQRFVIPSRMPLEEKRPALLDAVSVPSGETLRERLAELSKKVEEADAERAAALRAAERLAHDGQPGPSRAGYPNGVPVERLLLDERKLVAPTLAEEISFWTPEERTAFYREFFHARGLDAGAPRELLVLDSGQDVPPGETWMLTEQVYAPFRARCMLVPFHDASWRIHSLTFGRVNVGTTNQGRTEAAFWREIDLSNGPLLTPAMHVQIQIENCSGVPAPFLAAILGNAFPF